MDNLNIYSVYDVDLDVYSPPMFFSSDVEARRAFKQFALPLNRSIYEGSFELRLIGHFSVKDGNILSSSIEILEVNNSDYYKEVPNANE